MAPLTATIEVDRSAEEVFAYATDPSRLSEWQKGVVAGAMATPTAPKVGDLCVTTRRIGFVTRTFTDEIARADSPTSWAVRGVNGPIRASVDVQVEALSDTRARLTISLEFEGHGIGRLLAPLIVTPQARKEMPTNLATLKQRVEAAPAAAP